MYGAHPMSSSGYRGFLPRAKADHSLAVGADVKETHARLYMHSPMRPHVGVRNQLSTKITLPF
jgi:hypothetical protein